MKRDRVVLRHSNNTSLTTKRMLHFGHHVFWPSSSLLDMCYRYSGMSHNNLWLLNLILIHGLWTLSAFSGLNWTNFNHFFFHFYRNAQNAFYKVLLANAATSALRLHQRMPRLTFTREYFALLLVEDSCHYLFFSTIFLYVSPFILILMPVGLFAILHAASYSLTLLDVSCH